MNDLPSSQQPPTSDDTPARDTGVSRIHLSSVGFFVILIIIILLIIIIIIPNIFLAHTPAGAESDLNAAAA